MLYIKTKNSKQQKFFATYSTDFAAEREKMRFLSWTALFLVLFCRSAEAKVKVIDGDSLIVDGTEIRLEGIDAPEYHQYCYDKNDEPYHCGDDAFQALKALAGEDTSCKQTVVDRYHRSVAICTSRGKVINKEMVRQGHAVAYTRYTKAYAEAEKEARAAKRGIWQGRFMVPELYRALQRKGV